MNARRLLFLLCGLTGPVAAADAPRADSHGDPLPRGAVARLGAAQLRTITPGLMVLRIQQMVAETVARCQF